MYKKRYVAPAMLVVVADLQHILAGSGDSGASGGGTAGTGGDSDGKIDVSGGGDASGDGDGSDEGPVVESRPHTNAWSVWDD